MTPWVGCYQPFMRLTSSSPLNARSIVSRHDASWLPADERRLHNIGVTGHAWQRNGTTTLLDHMVNPFLSLHHVFILSPKVSRFPSDVKRD